jgi:lysophospholipase L1-like esterase
VQASQEVENRAAVRPFVKRLILCLALLPSAVLLLLVVAECVVRAVYGYAMWRTERFPLLYERSFWEVPPWAQYMSILRDDPGIGIGMQPHVSRTYINLFGPIGDLAEVAPLFSELFPKLPPWAERREPWHLHTNALGFRDDDRPEHKPPGTFRVAVMGDSWTVGINVERDGTYPAQLARRLQEEYPHGRFEVLNFGLIGGASDVGERLLPRVLAFEPDVLVLAYAQNDEDRARQGPTTVAHLPAASASSVWNRIANLEVLKLVSWYRRRQPDSIAATIQHDLERPHGPPNNVLRRPCGYPLPEESVYHETMDGLVRTAQERGIDVVLVNNNTPEFFSQCTFRALARIAAERSVPLVDSATLLFDKRQADGMAFDAARHLEPSPADGEAEPGRATIVFRVDMTKEGEGRPAFIMGNSDQLGSFTPNRVALFDDGTHGDQVANDGIWSRAVDFDAGTTLIYLFTNGTREGEWTGLENYHPRVFALHQADLGTQSYPPIAEFGRMRLRSDGYHPDAEGYEAIGDAVFDAVKRGQRLEAYVQRTAQP